MRVPVIPVVVLLLATAAGVGFLVFSSPSRRALGVPVTASLADVEGVETEVAIAPDGLRYALIASGDLWYVELGNEASQRLTDTPEPESAPAWTGDGRQITFSRGPDTFEIDPREGAERLRLTNAAQLSSWGDARVAFVRDRALWLEEAGELRELVPPDPHGGVSIRSPRFSPDGGQILFVKTLLDIHGEVWRVDLGTGDAFPVIADRPAENPSAAEWVGDDRHFVYLTDRSGGIAVWYVDLEAATLRPITPPLMARAPGPLGLDVHGTRIVVPRITIDSDIVDESGRVIAGGPGLQMEPAISADGARVAFTEDGDGGWEIWMVELATGERRQLGFGRSPRFAPDGNQIVYATTRLNGNRDIWKSDVRTGLQTPLADGDSMEDRPDWSPDGQHIVFASDRSGMPALWTVPASGGRSQALGASGLAPRFSPIGDRIAFWEDGAIRTVRSDGSDPVRIAEAATPAPPVWRGAGLFFYGADGIGSAEGAARVGPMWPEFEATGDGWLISTLEVQASSLWSIDLTFVED